MGFEINDFSGRTGWGCPNDIPPPCTISGDQVQAGRGRGGPAQRQWRGARSTASPCPLTRFTLVQTLHCRSCRASISRTTTCGRPLWACWAWRCARSSSGSGSGRARRQQRCRGGAAASARASPEPLPCPSPPPPACSLATTCWATCCCASPSPATCPSPPPPRRRLEVGRNADFELPSQFCNSASCNADTFPSFHCMSWRYSSIDSLTAPVDGWPGWRAPRLQPL